jgi:3-methyl-2-oxobutanoate hydroxymethyltransferase
MKNEKIRVSDFRRKKEEGTKITALTGYDKTTAELISMENIDLILVGDSLGMVVLGYETTIPVTLDEMIHHAKAVMRGVGYSFTCIDMPFMTYQGDINKAIENCGRAIKETGIESVKIEGNFSELIELLSRAGIPVLGHIGFIPQSFHKFGGYKIAGKDHKSAYKLVQDAKNIEKAGAYAIVLECIPEQVATIITKELKIPTIGIGSGKNCDGQILVINDILGLYKPIPGHVKIYANLEKIIKKAINEYKKDVHENEFPDENSTYKMKQEEYDKLKKMLED